MVALKIFVWYRFMSELFCNTFMSRHLHIDAFSGVSGDMFLGALVDLGVSLRTLERGLKTLGVKGYRLQAEQVTRNSLRATKVDVNVRAGFDSPLSFSKIRTILKKSGLPPSIKAQALQVFQFIAEAEGAAHGKPITRVHFHEVGVIDSLVDIVGTLLGIARLQIETISIAPINVGGGMVDTAHGQLPVPGPAVAYMARGLPIYSSGPAIELTTPTGMALAKTLSTNFKPLPALTPERIGYGAGSADPTGWPNVLRLFLSNGSSTFPDRSERIVQLESNIDDMNPQVYEAVMDRLFEAGALDVTLTPTLMKRSRPGIVLNVVAPPKYQHTLAALLFSETSTLGIRIQELDRYVLARTFQTIRVLGQSVQMKVVELGKGHTKVSPEFRDCLAIAQQTNRPVREILELARQKFAKTIKPQTAPRSKTPKKITRRGV